MSYITIGTWVQKYQRNGKIQEDKIYSWRIGTSMTKGNADSPENLAKSIYFAKKQYGIDDSDIRNDDWAGLSPKVRQLDTNELSRFRKELENISKNKR